LERGAKNVTKEEKSSQVNKRRFGFGKEVYVIDLYPEVLEIAPALQERLSKEAREILDRAKERAEQENISCETIVHVGGQPHEYIIQEAKKREADLIVMGTQGRTGLKKLIIGSVAQRVLAHAPCPVLVTPA
jgi:nucleotide-binding universal stress UspA family protein